MSLFSFGIALFLLGIAIACALAIYWMMFGPLFAVFRVGTGGSKIRRAEQRLKRVDELISENKFDEAIRLLRKAVLLDPAVGSRSFGRLKDHHQNVLSRCLVIAEEAGSRADNIAKVEHLLMQRVELLVLLVKAEESFKNLKTRREQAGKEIPSWSKTDFQARIKEIQSELAKNEADSVRELDELFRMLGGQAGASIVYH